MPSFDLTRGDLALLAVTVAMVLLPGTIPRFARLLERRRQRAAGPGAPPR
jgi:hypothetical protein